MPIVNKPQNHANRRRCLAFIIAGIILHTLIIIAFIVIFLRVRTPRVRIRSVTIENTAVNPRKSPFFNTRLNAEVAVKNNNFGHFKFPHSKLSILYRGNNVGSAVIREDRVGARSTKKTNVTLTAVDTRRDPALSGDLNSGRITLSTLATLDGKIHLFKIVKKKKTATLNCTMDVITRTRSVENLRCH